MSAIESVRQKAWQILREGRVTVLFAECDTEQLVVTKAVVRVQGARQAYVVDYRHGAQPQWRCNCPLAEAGAGCGHVLASQMVTGHAELPAVRAA